MARSADRQPRIAFVVLPALLGLVYCTLNAFGAELLCVSSGCGIYAGYTLGGLSIHALGAVAFGAILLLALLAQKRPPFRYPLFTILLFGLLIDTLFLIWQILYWPCTSCLVVALLLALCVLGARKGFPTFRSRVVQLALLLWFVAFVPVSVAAGKEFFIKPWPAMGPADAPVAVYFSPTCAACEKTIREILQLPSVAEQAAFFPIAKNEEDLQRLAWLLESAGEIDLALLFSIEDGPPVQPGLALRWKLARNKMALARLGVDRVPLVVTPSLVQTAPSVYLPLEGAGEFPADLFGSPSFDAGCSADAPVDAPCD